MPLPPPTKRNELHHRRVDCRGFEREDGLFDIEGHVTDWKKYEYERPDGREVPLGEPVHDMWVRLTIDEDLHVRDVAASTNAAPYAPCFDAAKTLEAVRGLRIAAGWGKEIRKRLGGVKSCTHLVELLGPVATTAYQTLATIRWRKPLPVSSSGRPLKIDSCFAYASDREVVRAFWPEHYTGEDGKT